MTKILTLLTILMLTSSCEKNKIIYVADSLVDCQGVSPQKCMQIKEAKGNDWTYFYHKIDGFEYKEGYTYKIEVAVSKIKNPPADGSSLGYKLVRVIYQEPSTTKMTTNSFSTNWKIIAINGLEDLKVNPTLNFDFDAQKISGKAGCNNYGATFVKKENSLSFEKTFATKMTCSNMGIEKAYLEGLSNVKTYTLLDNTLTFYDANNIELMRCAKLEE